MAVRDSGTVRAAAMRSSASSLERACSIGLKSGLYAGRRRSDAAAGLDSASDASAILMRQVMQDDDVAGHSVGTRTCSTQAGKAVPFMAPSRTIGAVVPLRRRPAVKVAVFQCTCGTAARQRSPRRDRPPEPRHLGRSAGVIPSTGSGQAEDQLLGVEVEWAVEPGPPRFKDVGTLLLRRMRDLFLTSGRVGRGRSRPP